MSQKNKQNSLKKRKRSWEPREDRTAEGQGEFQL